MSSIDMAVLPLLYQVRHLPRGKKKAISTVLREDLVFDLPHWDEADAPLVARVVQNEAGSGPRDVYQGRQTDYRVARSLDGVVRLMAPATSAGASPRLLQQAIHAAGPSPVDKLAKAAHFQQHLALTDITPMTQVGQILVSERDIALALLRRLVSQAAVINDEIWVPVSPPGWNLYSDYGLGANGQYGAHFVITPTPAGSGPEENVMSRGNVVSLPASAEMTSQAFLQHLLEASTDQRLVQHLRDQDADVEHPYKVDILHPEALAFDAAWNGDARRLVRELSSMRDANIHYMMHSEAQSFFRLKQHALNWPERRSQEVVKDLMVYARALHSMSPSNFKGTLDMATALVKRLQTIRPPKSLDKVLPFELPSIEDIRAPAPQMAV